MEVDDGVARWATDKSNKITKTLTLYFPTIEEEINDEFLTFNLKSRQLYLPGTALQNLKSGEVVPTIPSQDWFRQCVNG
jgi:hypothetical protein